MADQKELINTLQKVPLFASFKSRHLEKLAKHFAERKFNAGDEIVKQGSGGIGFFVIASGRVDVVRVRSDGELIKLNTFGPGEFFGELALLDDGVRTATVVALEPTLCLVLTRWDFLAVLKEDPDMAIEVLEQMAKRFRAALEAL